MLIDHIFPAVVPPGPEETFIAPHNQAMSELAGACRCNRLHLDIYGEGDGLACRLQGQEARLIVGGKDRVSIASPIFGNTGGRGLRGDHGKLTGLLINIAFSELCFKKSE
jgi:hypothetical protein